MFLWNLTFLSHFIGFEAGIPSLTTSNNCLGPSLQKELN